MNLIYKGIMRIRKLGDQGTSISQTCKEVEAKES